MQSVKIVYWEESGVWLGYLDEYPDYHTQGETLDDLREHLKGPIPGHFQWPNPRHPEGRRLGDLVKRVDLIRIRVFPQPVPRHREINENLARHIIKKLGNA